MAEAAKEVLNVGQYRTQNICYDRSRGSYLPSKAEPTKYFAKFCLAKSEIAFDCSLSCSTPRMHGNSH